MKPYSHGKIITSTLSFWLLFSTPVPGKVPNNSTIPPEYENSLQVMEGREFMGEKFRNQGQLNIFKLFLAKLDPSPEIISEKSHDVMLVTSMAGGLGDYTYLHKTAKLLQDNQADLDIGVAAETAEYSTILVNKVFQPSYTRYMTSYDDPELLGQTQGAVDHAPFAFYLAAVPYHIRDTSNQNQSFFIGEIIHFEKPLFPCESESCEDEQLKWLDERFIEDEREYSQSVLNREYEDDSEDYFCYEDEAGFENGQEEAYYFENHQTNELQACNPKSRLSDCTYAPRFGIGSTEAGILIDNDIQQKTKEYQEAGNKYDTAWFKNLMKLSYDVLEAITGSKNPLEQQNFFLQNTPYYAGYFHEGRGKLSFIRSILHAHPDEDVQMILPLSQHDIESGEIQLGLKVGGVASVRLWTKGSGWEEYPVEEASPSGRTIQVINLYPLPIDALQALVFFSNPVVGTTGDHSFYAAISMGKLPYQEVMTHQFFLRHQLGMVAKQPTIKAFYHSLDPSVHGDLMQQLQQDSREIKQFTTQLIDQYSANGLLQSIVRTAVQPSAAIRDFLSSIDEVRLLPIDQQDAFLQDLGSDYADVARARLILSAIDELEQNAPGQARSLILKNQCPSGANRLVELMSKIQSKELRLVMQEAIDVIQGKYEFENSKEPTS